LTDYKRAERSFSLFFAYSCVMRRPGLTNCFEHGSNACKEYKIQEGQYKWECHHEPGTRDFYHVASGSNERLEGNVLKNLVLY
jgi:hypothetical protein